TLATMHGGDGSAASMADMEIMASSKAAKFYVPDTIKTIDVEYHPKLSAVERMRNLAGKLSYAEQLELFAKHQPDYQNDDISSRLQHGQSLSDQLRAESDRAITEVFESEETRQTVRRGMTRHGMIVEQTHEEVTTTRFNATRDVFKFM